MSTAPPGDVEITRELVSSLLVDQHPDLATRSLAFVGSGWDHVMVRLGDDLCVRLPRRELGARMIAGEQRFLADHGADLPLPVPIPLRTGQPAVGYPYRWSVVPWLAGRPATLDPPVDQHDAALRLGRFLGALHRPASADAPHNPFRGVPLADRVVATGDGDTDTLWDRLERVSGRVDRERLERVVEAALTAPPWSGRPTWCHGDLHPRNVLVDEGRISAVIDFSDVCGGDPAVDAVIAWMLLDPSVHGIFRHQTASLDDHTWTRGKGWAVHLALTIHTSSDDHTFRTAAERALRNLAAGVDQPH